MGPSHEVDSSFYFWSWLIQLQAERRFELQFSVRAFIAYTSYFQQYVDICARLKNGGKSKYADLCIFCSFNIHGALF